MVNPDTPCDFDGCKFQFGLEEDRVRHGGGSFRYEFFFLPGATAEECAAHYRGEIDARGTIWRQIRKVKKALEKKKKDEGDDGADDLADDPADNSDEGSSGDEPQDGTAGERLPGLVWPRYDSDCDFVYYRGWLFMYPDADVEWGATSKDREVNLVRFDPIPIEWEEGEVVRWDPMEHPIYSVQMSARGRDRMADGAAYWMEDRKSTHWEKAANAATCNAQELGWESW